MPGPLADFRYHLSLTHSAVLRAFPCLLHPHKPPLLLPSPSALNPFVQEGEFYARHEKSNITVLIPKAFYNQSFEAEEAAKELAKKIKAEEAAKALTIQAAKKTKAEERASEVAKKSAASKMATVSTTKKKTHQKPATTEQTTAPAPAKEDAPVTTHQ